MSKNTFRREKVVGLITIVVMILVMGAAFYISSRLSSGKSLFPNAPESKPSAATEICDNATLDEGKCGAQGGCQSGYMCSWAPKCNEGSTEGCKMILNCVPNETCSTSCPRLAWKCDPSNNNRRVQCNGDGTAYDQYQGCDAGFGCKNGLCNKCKPGNATCSTQGITTCNSDGQGYSLSNTCQNGYIYDCNTNKCKYVNPTTTVAPAKIPTSVKAPYCSRVCKCGCTPSLTGGYCKPCSTKSIK